MARRVITKLVASKLASLTCQGRQAISPDLTHFPSSSHQAPQGLSPAGSSAFFGLMSLERPGCSQMSVVGIAFQTLMVLVTPFILEELS